METKVVIDSLGMVTLKCPKCNTKKTLLVSQYKIHKSMTRIRCRCGCGEIFCVVLELNEKNARDMQLLGICTSKEQELWSGRMTVKRLNARGLTIMLNIKQKTTPGHKLLLEFVLDDAKQSIVKKQAIVTATDGPYISADFLSREHFDNLGPYLFFNKLLG